MPDVQQQLLSGAVSGFVTTLSLQPFDLVKTRLQQGDGLSAFPKTHSFVIFGAAKEVVSRSGLKGLWRGTVPSLFRNVPGIALYMTGLTQLRTYMAQSPYFAVAKKQDSRNKTASVLPALTMQGNLIAGATLRVLVGFLLNPFSVLKARYESNYYQYNNLPVAMWSLVRQGPSELLRGFLASSLRDAPHAGLFIVFYEAIKRESSSIYPSSSHKDATIVHSMSAATASVIATLLSHPFDVVKTKLQVRTEDRYRGFFRTIYTIWKQRGISGYFDGASLRLSRKVFSSALGWAVYEGLLMAFKQPSQSNI